MKKYKLVLLSVLFVCTAVSEGIAQSSVTAVNFLRYNNNARSLGLGGATVALQNHEAGAHLNPAIIGKPGHLEVSSPFLTGTRVQDFPYYRVSSSDNSDLTFYMPSLSVSIDRWSVSYQYSHMNIEEQTHITPRGAVLGTFKSREYAHTLTAAYQVNNYFSVGAGFNLIRSRLQPQGIFAHPPDPPVGSSISLDIGIHGRYPFLLTDNIKITPSAGWSLTDFGEGIKYSENAPSDPLPMMMRGGWGLKLEYEKPVERFEMLSDKSPVSVAFYQSFEKGMARKDSIGASAMPPFKALFHSWDEVRLPTGSGYQLFTLGEQIGSRGGIELTLFEMIHLRGGYFNEAEVNGGRRATSLGLGLQYKMFSLDYVNQEWDKSEQAKNGDRQFLQFSVALSLERINRWFNIGW